MSAISLMTFLLIIVMLVIGGKKGAMALLSIMFNLVAIVVVIWLMVKGVPIFGVIIMFATITLLNNFFLFNEEIDKYHTKVSFVASASLILLMSLVLPFVVNHFYSYGFAAEELDELGPFSFDILISYQEVFVVLVIVAMIGAVIDGAIAVASAMNEIEEEHPELTAKELRQSGIKIGRDIVSTTMTTLLLAFFGNYLGIILFIMDFDYGLPYLLNAQLVVNQLVVMLLSAIGTLLILPLTAYLYAKMKK